MSGSLTELTRSRYIDDEGLDADSEEEAIQRQMEEEEEAEFADELGAADMGESLPSMSCPLVPHDISMGCQCVWAIRRWLTLLCWGRR